jgi:hypothetical protein
MKRAWSSFLPACALFIAGCPGGEPECVNATSGAEAQFVADTLLVPESRSDFAYDLNGDGKLDNQLGNIIGALAQQGLKTQDSVNEALMNGSVILLMHEKGADLTNNDCASVEIAVGNTMMMPDFTGNGMFTKNPAIGGGTLKGKITNGIFDSNPSSSATTEPKVTIQLPLVAGSDPLRLNITGAHIKFTKSGDKVTTGQLNGGILKKDIDDVIVPNVAQLLSDRITADPNSSTNMQILSLFDNGGADEGCSGACKNKDGSCGVSGDKKIQVCEVATNSIIKNVLAPDVQLFQGGAYKPNAGNETKDSLSLGLKFTAVKAKF